jgi:hypothetical protein
VTAIVGGERVVDVAGATGIIPKTLHRWVREGQSGQRSGRSFTEFSVIPASHNPERGFTAGDMRSGNLSLVGRHGCSVYGLCLADIARLMVAGLL